MSDWARARRSGAKLLLLAVDTSRDGGLIQSALGGGGGLAALAVGNRGGAGTSLSVLVRLDFTSPGLSASSAIGQGEARAAERKCKSRTKSVGRIFRLQFRSLRH